MADSSWAEEQVASLEGASASLWPSIERLSESELEQRLPEGRSIKEILAHVAFWEEAAVGYVRGALRGEKIAVEDWYGGTSLGYEEGTPWPDADTHNAREADWAATQPGALVLERVKRARQLLLELLGTIRDDEAAGDAGVYLKPGNLAHSEEHLVEIHEWFESQDSLPHIGGESGVAELDA